MAMRQQTIIYVMEFFKENSILENSLTLRTDDQHWYISNHSAQFRKLILMTS